MLGDLAPAESLSYLSGLLVGADVIGALALFHKLAPDIASVSLIGDRRLSEYYRLVLDHLGVQAQTCDAERITVAGYGAIYKYIYAEDF